MKGIENILKDIYTVLDIVKGFSDDDYINELEELEEKLEDDKFHLVVTGLFKRGKSSVINALIGKEIAPVGVIPVTAVVTLFEYAKASGCEVKFNDGRSKKIPWREISHYVSEEENPENTKDVSQLTVYCNENDLLKKCCILDTPGLGSVFEHNSQTTYNYIPKIDAALFILSADIPISKADADFLREISSTVPHIIYVLNKIDLPDKNQLETLIRFNTKAIADITNKKEQDIILIPISCKLKAENKKAANFEVLIDAISRLMEENKKDILTETGQKRLNTIIDNVKKLLTVKAETIQMPVKMIEEKHFRLKQSMDVMSETRHEFDILVKGQLHKILEKHMVKADAMILELSKELKQEISSAFHKNIVINTNNMVKLSEEYANKVISCLEKIKQTTEDRIILEFNQLLAKYTLRPESFFNEFARILDDLFGLSFEVLAGQFNFDVYTSFYFLNFVNGQSAQPKLRTIHKILPDKLQRLKCQSILKKNAEILIEVNKGRMKSDMMYKVNESFRKFKTEEEKQVEEVYLRMNTLLEEAIKDKMKSKIEIERELKNIKDKIEIMNSVIYKSKISVTGR